MPDDGFRNRGERVVARAAHGDDNFEGCVFVPQAMEVLLGLCERARLPDPDFVSTRCQGYLTLRTDVSITSQPLCICNPLTIDEKSCSAILIVIISVFQIDEE